MMKMDCKQGLILLQFSNPDTKKSPSEIAKSLGVMTSKQVTTELEVFKQLGLLETDSASGKYVINPNFNQAGESVVSFLPQPNELIQQDNKMITEFDF